MASADSRKESMAGILHDLRTPLNAIVGFSTLLAQTNNGELSDKQRRFLERITSASSELMRLVNQLEGRPEARQTEGASGD